jgi:hypothetical protein
MHGHPGRGPGSSVGEPPRTGSGCWFFHSREPTNSLTKVFNTRVSILVWLSMREMVIAGVLGGCGGALYELVELARFLRGHGHYPWSPRRRPRVVRVGGVLRRYETFAIYLTTIFIRVIVGGGVSLALAAAGSLSHLAAVVAGIAGYSIIDRWADARGVHDGSPTTTSALDPSHTAPTR